MSRLCRPRYFNPRSPRGGATIPTDRDIIAIVEISIHAPHEGERQLKLRIDIVLYNFNPRSPRGGATPTSYNQRRTLDLFQSTLPTRGSDNSAKFVLLHDVISIHAPHEGERLKPFRRVRADNPFQSTLPTRGSDDVELPRVAEDRDFNPRSPRGGATLKDKHDVRVVVVDFNPRSPRGGATHFLIYFSPPKFISIHAPHEGERHRQSYEYFWYSKYFNPRSPRGGATAAIVLLIRSTHRFQSTLPTRGSDRHGRAIITRCDNFNPRSPRGGATSWGCVYGRKGEDFNPRSPRGGATVSGRA